MNEATEYADAAGRILPTPPLFSTPADAATLRDVLRRCSPATYEAACRFRRTGDPALLPTLIPGLLERYVEPDLRPRLRDSDDTLRLAEDLGLDSLTLIEFVMFAEDVLQLAIDNDELGRIHTLAELRRSVEIKLVGLVPPHASALLEVDLEQTCERTEPCRSS